MFLQYFLKIFFFDDRTRYKNIGMSAQILCNGDYSCFLLEDEDNEKRRPEDFNFHRFSRQKYLWGANLVAYTIRQNNEMTKAVIYRNKGYDFVPLNYSSNQCDFVFYLNKGKTEKFAIYSMSQP